jgi:hypothetical protein
MAFFTQATERARLSSDGTFRVKGAGTAGSTDAVQFSGSAPANSLILQSNGNLLVGTTTIFPGVSGLGGNIQGMMSEAGGSFFLSRVDSNPVLFVNRGGTNGDIVRFAKDTTTVGTISVTSSATAYNTSSDYRLKENIQPMTGALAKVAALKPCTFNWKANGSAGQGFIAHELAEVVPDCVIGEKDAVNKDGSINPQGVDTSFLVATLTAAIQELRAEFDAYTATHP